MMYNCFILSHYYAALCFSSCSDVLETAVNHIPKDNIVAMEVT